MTLDKNTGRKLRGKSMGVISCSNGNNLDSLFWEPFKNSAEYLGMHYLADLHTYQGKLDVKQIANFKNQIEINYSNS